MKYNNAESTLAGDITASGTAIVLKNGEGDLFPSTGYPEKFKIEHFEGSVVTKREVFTVSGRTGDILTISDRASEPCVQDESLETKTRTQDAYSFSSGDTISMTITESDYNGIIDNFNTFKNTTVPNTYATKDEVKKSELVYGSSSTGTDDYAITVSGITAYQDGMTFRVKSDVANTGSCTLDVNGIGAKAVKKQQGTVDLVDGDWGITGIATVVYNSDLDCFQFEGEVVNAVVVEPSKSTQSGVILGETVSAGDALRSGAIISLIEASQKTGTATGNEERIGYSTTYEKIGQSFTVTGSNKVLQKITCALRSSNSPTDQITCKVYSDTAGTLVATSINKISETSLSTSYVDNTFEFSNESLPAGTFYIELSVTRANDTTNFSMWGSISSDIYAGGQMYVINSSNTWTAYPSEDRNFEVQTGDTTEDVTKKYKTDTLEGGKTNFIGFASESGVLDDVIKMNTSGVDGNQVELIPGAEYFLGKRLVNIVNSNNLTQTTGALGGNEGIVGAIGGNIERQGQDIIIPSGDNIFKSIDIDILKINTPPSSIQCKVYQSNKTTLIGTSLNSFSASDVTTGYATYTFNFDNLQIPSNTTLFLEFSVDGAKNNSSYYRIAYDNTQNGSGLGNHYYYTGSTWTTRAGFYTKMNVQLATSDISEISTEGAVKVGKAISATEVEIYPFNNDNLNGESTTSATTGGVTLGNAEGYITIKVNGVDKKIPYYGV